MNALKKILGVVWLLLGPVAVWYLIKTAAAEIAAKPVMDTEDPMGCIHHCIHPDMHWPDDIRILCHEGRIQPSSGKIR